MVLTVPENAASPPSAVPSLPVAGSVPPWISFVARTVVWIGSAAPPEAARARRQPITPSFLNAPAMVGCEGIRTTFECGEVLDHIVCSQAQITRTRPCGVSLPDPQ